MIILYHKCIKPLSKKMIVVLYETKRAQRGLPIDLRPAIQRFIAKTIFLGKPHTHVFGMKVKLVPVPYKNIFYTTGLSAITFFNSFDHCPLIYLANMHVQGRSSRYFSISCLKSVGYVTKIWSIFFSYLSNTSDIQLSLLISRYPIYRFLGRC